MARHGLPAPPLIDVPMDARKTTAAVSAFLSTTSHRPTALLCANEENAIGAARALQQAGLHIPDDISLLSFNDTPLSALVEPPLTSVSTHVREMAFTAVRLLAERCTIGDRPPVRTIPQKVIVPPGLVLRESVKRLARPG